MTESLVQWFSDTLGNIFSPGFIIFIISMMPILELRGGLIAARLFDINYWQALAICICGNIVPIPLVLFLLTPLFNCLKKTKLFRPLVEKLEARAMSKSDKIQQYEFWGLVLFVGIPLPGTGAWTGGLIASMLGIRPKKAIPAILLGICMAAAIMSIITYVIPWVISLF